MKNREREKKTEKNVIERNIASDRLGEREKKVKEKRESKIGTFTLG